MARKGVDSVRITGQGKNLLGFAFSGKSIIFSKNQEGQCIENR